MTGSGPSSVRQSDPASTITAPMSGVPATTPAPLRLSPSVSLDGPPKYRDELSVLEQVAIDILSIREVDQVLLSITREALGLIEADMAGVLLLEDGSLSMRCCVGHRSARTASLRMQTGQGVAGLVLERGEPCKIDSYLESDAISHEFDPLALEEGTKSALGAPLKAQGEIMGVLEVWRRRESLFTNRHERRIVRLANLAAIAIENARLYDRQEQSVSQLGAAQEYLSRQLSVLKEVGTMQRALIQLLLDGEGLAAIVRTIATQLGAPVLVFSSDFEPVAWYPRTIEPAEVGVELRRISRELNVRSGSTTAVLSDNRWLTVHAIVAGRDGVGWFCSLSEQAPGGSVELALGEAVLACGLSQLEQLAADRARAEAREEILWDLLEGSAEHRRSAIPRAKRLRIELSQPHRVVHGVIEDLDDVAHAEGWDEPQMEKARRQLLDSARRVLSEQAAGELVTLRGNALVAVVSIADASRVRTLVRALDAEVQRVVPGAKRLWGVSADRDNPIEYGPANGEAKLAVRAARRMGGERVAIYDQLGVVRVLLGSDENGDLQRFVEDVIGPLVEHDRKHSGALIATLRAYFAANCSQQLAAEQLFVHHKTLRYRLDRIEQLTELDLRRHDDRLKADLALKVFDLLRA
jgi:sugar diacid utilization regulator